MAYDFHTDIDNLTQASGVSSPIKDWCVDWAKSLYIADDPVNYDEDLSFVDNRLVSILASAFVVAYINGSDVATSFQLDEFKVEFGDETSVPEQKFISMFWSWLNHYLKVGVSLQYKQSSTLHSLTVYDVADYITTRSLPEGIE